MNQYPPPESYPQEPQPRYVRVALPSVTPWVTYALLAITILAYLLQLAGEYLLHLDYLMVIGIKYGEFIRAGQVWRLITPVFLHGSILHIAWNMYALVIFGRGLEARFGHGRFLLLYFLSAFAGNVMSFLFTPAASLGASTAIFGLLAAEGIFLFQNRQLLGSQASRAIGNIIMVAGINLFFGFVNPGVDNFGHIGGLLGGLLFAWFGGPRWVVEGVYPLVRLVDQREANNVILGAGMVIFIFGALATIGIVFPITP